MMKHSQKTSFGITAPAVAGMLAITIGIAGFGWWASTAPLDGAVIAQGTVVASDRNKTIQHLAGGTVDQLHVREGDRVSVGDILMQLDPTDAEVNRNRISSRLDKIDVQRASLLAEQKSATQISFSDELMKRSAAHTALAQMIYDQKEEFAARLNRFKSELEILGKQRAAFREEIAGLSAQKEAVSRQLDLVEMEIVDSEKLLERKLVQKSKVLTLHRARIELSGRLGQLLAAIAKAKQSIIESEMQTERLHAKRVEEASQQLNLLRSQRSDLQEQLRSVEQNLARTRVTATANGTVMNISTAGRGSVVAPGEELMVIVPSDAGLVVEAKIRPQDIDQVSMGQPVQLVFQAFGSRNTDPVDGRVLMVSPDSNYDARTGQAFYAARLEIDRTAMQNVLGERSIGPGHPVDAFIKTGERTLISYLLEPITDTVRRSMREAS